LRTVSITGRPHHPCRRARWDRGAIRFYLTEHPDGTATLSYKKPTTVFAPYAEEGKDALKGLAAELDEIFAKIAELATK